MRARVPSCLLLAVVAAATDEPAPLRVLREGAERGGDPGAVVALESALADFAGTPDEQLALDLLATRLTFVGDARGAARRDGEAFARPRRYSRGGPDAVDGMEPRDASAWILERARDLRVLMLNEEHRTSRQRAYLHELLAPLAEAGFTHLALETLTTDPDEIAALTERGAPVEGDGFYTRDPVLGDAVRRALELGFGLVGYEADTSAMPHEVRATPVGATNWREREQARALAAFLEAHPDARLVVWCGRHHLSEEPPVDDGVSWTPMGGLLAREAGVDPLTVDLMIMTEHALPEVEPEVYRAVADRLEAPTVFVDDDGRPYSCLDGIDAMVFLPRTRWEHGRPDWMAMGGVRAPRTVSFDAVAPAPGRPLLLEARVAGEPPDTIPLDRALWRDGDPPALMLRPGREYVVRVVDPDGEVVASR